MPLKEHRRLRGCRLVVALAFLTSGLSGSNLASLTAMCIFLEHSLQPSPAPTASLITEASIWLSRALLLACACLPCASQPVAGWCPWLRPGSGCSRGSKCLSLPLLGVSRTEGSAPGYVLPDTLIRFVLPRNPIYLARPSLEILSPF